MSKVTIRTGTPEQFFARGRRLARAADAGGRIPAHTILSFEDPADVLKLLTPARLAVFQAARDQPGSITSLSDRLKRDRSAVKRDVDELERAGLLKTEMQVLPGHGLMKHVRLAARRFNLEARLA